MICGPLALQNIPKICPLILYAFHNLCLQYTILFHYPDSCKAQHGQLYVMYYGYFLLVWRWWCTNLSSGAVEAEYTHSPAMKVCKTAMLPPWSLSRRKSASAP